MSDLEKKVAELERRYERLQFEINYLYRNGVPNNNQPAPEPDTSHVQIDEDGVVSVDSEHYMKSPKAKAIMEKSLPVRMTGKTPDGRTITAVANLVPQPAPEPDPLLTDVETIVDLMDQVTANPSAKAPVAALRNCADHLRKLLPRRSAPEPIDDTFCVGCVTESDCALFSCQEPVPKPEQQWRVDGDSIYYGHGAHNRMNNKTIADLLNAHKITPDSKPIDRERGRELVRQIDFFGEKPDRFSEGREVIRQMRDWINEICGE